MASFPIFAVQAWTPGDHFSPTVHYNGKGTFVDLLIVSSTWQTDDTSIVVTVEAQQSLDGGASWGAVATFTCSPGPLHNKLGLATTPDFAFEVNDDLGGREVRARINPSATLTFGLNGTTT